MNRCMLAILALCLLGITPMLHAAETDADKLKESLAKWEKAREACGGDYTLTYRWSSYVGFGHTTTITVKGNQVVERKFEEFSAPKPVKPGEEAPKPTPKWVETGKEIGTHKEGAPAVTLDELYKQAATMLSAEVPANNRRLVGYSKDGLLNYCFTQDKRIADDAPANGIKPFQIQLKAK